MLFPWSVVRVKLHLPALGSTNNRTERLAAEALG